MRSLLSLRAGGSLMPRRRSTNPTKAISITLPLRLLDQVDDQLTRIQSRSAWIADAIRTKLDDNAGLRVEDASDKEMLVALVNRGAITKDQYDLLTSKES